MTGHAQLLLLCLSLLYTLQPSHSLGFVCKYEGATCQAAVGFVVGPNGTTLSYIKSLFTINDLHSLLAANNLPASTPAEHMVPGNRTVRIPFTCRCSNGRGTSDGSPIYTVRKDDGLYYIASVVYSYLVKYPDIQQVNRIVNADIIKVGQELLIPLPCSCDDVAGERVFHYGHMVAEGSSVEQIAAEYNVSKTTLMALNNLISEKDLMADQPFDVPLQACTSSIHNDSLDASLAVPNGTYAYTASNCVMCSCNSVNNWTLQCQPSQLAPSKWSVCPSMQCQGGENLYIGNTTSTSCSHSTCAYAGYTNQSILTANNTVSTCPAPPNGNNNNAMKIHTGILSWNFFVTIVWITVSL